MTTNSPTNLKRMHEYAATPAAASSTAAKSSNKRTRIEQACNNCRALRRKCNAASPCKACADNSLVCTYDGDVQPSERLTLAKAVKRIAYLEERLRLYEGSPDEDGVSQLFNVDVFSTKRTTHKPEDDMDRALRGINRLTLDPTRLPEFYGGSSSNMIINAIESTEDGPDTDLVDAEDLHIPENRALLWLGGPSQLSFGKASGSLLPPKPVAERYVACYFQTAHRIFPILNRRLFVGTFNDYYNGLPTEGKGYEWWTTVMYMTIALGHQYSLIDSDPTLRGQALASPQDGEACFLLAKSSLVNVPFAGGDISAVNSLMLMFLWLYNQQRLHEAYAVLGLAANVGYGIGLHRVLKNDPDNSAHIVGWCSTFWEIMAVVGRPCTIQAREVDITPFNMETSPVDLQYLERMRQFTYVTWDTWDQVYSLAYKHSSISDRGKALQRADETFQTWFRSWFHECPWTKEPHGLVIRLRFLHMRLLLYRAFLNLVVEKTRRHQRVVESVLDLAAKCVDISSETIKIVVTSIHPGSSVSGTLQGILFHALEYLWNAAVTHLLCAAYPAVQATLVSKITCNVPEDLRAAIGVFRVHEDAMPFSRAAGEKITNFLDNTVRKQGSQSQASSAVDASGNFSDDHATFDLPDLDFNLDLPVQFAAPGDSFGRSIRSLDTLSSQGPQWDFDEDMFVLQADTPF
ncbi:hypothetical protein PV08_09531 [Exophiala spinifera]|uniref:Zn(2)-C6 fungal-type domain-containing protein n=1 Tax=Exophiala spinifera TaxID=91928 RepID=A0A0D2B0L7_9EURO|nr:uncharacterized protein PV08_09531 [Exophiala spinifera]KIW12255.1 hypothetical protein PV08_09531 [Exophiala spinifera]